MSLLNALRGKIRGSAARRRFLSHTGRHRPWPPVLEALEDRMLLSYSFHLMAETGETGPDGPITGLRVGQAINDLGVVAFQADLNNGNEAIYRRALDGSLTTIASIDGSSSDVVLSPFMNDAGQVSFGVEMKDGGRAVLRGDGKDLTPIADTGSDSPFSSLPSGGAPQIHDNGTVYFRATLKIPGGAGLFKDDGTLHGYLYLTGGLFSAFLGAAEVQRHGDIASFRATLTTGLDCICKGSGGTVETIATTGGIYSAFLGSAINDAGTVVFGANLTDGGQVIVTPDGIFADTSGPYSQFFSGRLSSNNDGTVVFGADLKDGRQGIFRGPDPATDTIIATGDPLFNSTVTALPVNFITPKGLNDAGQIVFRAELADGRTVLAVAEPDGDGPRSVLQVAGLISAINLSGRAGGSVLVGMTGAVPSPSIDTSALSSLRFSDPALRDTATVRLSEPAMASSSRLGHDLHERVFADFAGDWLTDGLVNDLAQRV